MSQITHDNHFVPQMYLKQWSADGIRIWSYRTLVSHQNTNKWVLRSIRGVAFHRDLYTEVSNGIEIDEFEKWLEAEFETPAQEALLKVIREEPLTEADWSKLTQLLAAQDVRTPTSYLEAIDRWNKTLPTLLQNTLEDSVKKLEDFKREGKTFERVDTTNSLFSKSLKVNVIRNPKPEDGGFIEAKVVAGRTLWIESQRFLLQKTAKTLLKHKWGIAKPAKGFEWFTSDHPVVRLNYYKEGSYDLKGGWGKAKGNLIMPLSPNHLLFTQIGEDVPDYFVFSKEKTIEIQKFIAERAFRWVFSKSPLKIIEKYRPRKVDGELYNSDEENLKHWHENQILAEKSDD